MVYAILQSLYSLKTEVDTSENFKFNNSKCAPD